MSIFFKHYLLFKNGWDEADEADVEQQLIEASRNPAFEQMFMPAFEEFIKREQFMKIMECLDRDRNIEFNRGFVAGLDMVVNQLDRLRVKAEHKSK